MSDLKLDTSERELVEAMARDTHSPASRIGFFASVLVPVLAFAAYGIFKKDIVAVGLAFAGLLIFVWWRLSHEFTKVPIYKSLFTKILNHEKTEAQQGVPADVARPAGERRG
jgi:hypothetical protein